MFKSGPGKVEVISGDVFKYSTLPPALGDADTVVVATGASDRLDPLGPFNVDFQVHDHGCMRTLPQETLCDAS
jgi:hypothetical protein